MPRNREHRKCSSSVLTRGNELKADKAFVMVAVAKNGLALEHASYKLKGDKEVVLTAIAQNSEAIHHVSHQTTKQLVIDLHSKTTQLINENKQLKRKHSSLEQIVQKERKRIKSTVETEVKRATHGIQEDLKDAQEDLEEAQDTNGYLVRFQDKQMTQIDELKQQIKDLKDQVSRH